MHKTSKFSPNEIFYSIDKKLFGKVLENLPRIFKTNRYEKFLIHSSSQG